MEQSWKSSCRPTAVYLCESTACTRLGVPPLRCTVHAALQALNNGLQPDERQDFGFDLTSINWDEYIQYHIHGLRRFPLKGRMS